MTSTIQIAKYGTIDDLLFRGKNKSYGAYQLRQEYEHRLRRAFFLFMASLTSISVIVPVYNALMGNFIIVDEGSNPIGPVYNPNEFTEFEIEKPKVEIPKAAQDVKSIISVQPDIVANAPTADNKTTMDILDSDAAISSIDNQGTDIPKPSADPIVVAHISSQSSPLTVSDPNIVFDIVEEEPRFPGDLNKFLIPRMEFPPICQELGYTKEIVVVGFVVNEDGRISNIHLEKAGHESFNEQALKAVRSMPKWIPGSNNGHNVKVNMSIPFNFVLDE